MIYIKQPNNLYTAFDEDSGKVISYDSSIDNIIERAIENVKQQIETSSTTIMKAASTYSKYLEYAKDPLYLSRVGYEGSVDDFAKSIEQGPVAVTEIDTTRKERWGRCPNCGMTLWHKERGDYNEFHYKCGCGQLISWDKIQWYSENTEYIRCDGRMPGALQVVLQQTSSENFKEDTMIRFSTIVKSIPDITVGEYVISQDKYDSSWCSDKYRRCDGRMMNALLVVLDTILENEFDATTMIHIKDVQPFINDIQIGEYVILKDLFDEGFDASLEDTYIRCPSDMGGALQVVADSVSSEEFSQSSMIRINRIARFIPSITVGEYVIILEDYDPDYYGVDTFVKCPTNMPLCMVIVDDNTVIADYSTQVAYSVAKKLVTDPMIGEAIVDENYNDPQWNQYDMVNYDYYILVSGDPDPDEMNSYRLIVEDNTPMSEFNRDTMMKISSIRLIRTTMGFSNDTVCVGRYVHIASK